MVEHRGTAAPHRVRERRHVEHLVHHPTRLRSDEVIEHREENDGLRDDIDELHRPGGNGAPQKEHQVEALPHETRATHHQRLPDVRRLLQRLLHLLHHVVLSDLKQLQAKTGGFRALRVGSPKVIRAELHLE